MKQCNNKIKIKQYKREANLKKIDMDMNEVRTSTYIQMWKDMKKGFIWYIKCKQEYEVIEGNINEDDLIKWYVNICSDLGYKHMTEVEPRSYIKGLMNETKRSDICMIYVRNMIAYVGMVIIKRYINEKNEEMENICFNDVYGRLKKSSEKIKGEYIAWIESI